MLNWILAIVAVALWTGAYGWYFQHDIAERWTRWRTRPLPLKDGSV